MIEECKATAPNDEIFVIGHSHGGSVAAYLIKAHPSAARSLEGCAFLSTPFFAVRARDEGRTLLRTLLMLSPVALGMVFGSPLAQNLVTRLFGTPYLSLHLPVYWVFIIFFGTMGLVAVLLVTQARGFARSEKLLVQRAKSVINTQTADLPPGNYLFLRCSGDEAAAALSAVQFLGWLANLFSRFLAVLYRPFPRRQGWGTVVAFGYILVASIIFGIGSAETWPNIVRVAGKAFSQFSETPTFSLIFLLLIASVTFALLVSLIAFAAIFIFLAQATLIWAFGWGGWSESFFVNVAIEPLPFGSHILTLVDSAESMPDGIVHSWTYSHPKAIAHIQSWIEKSLATLPAGDAGARTTIP